MNNYALYSEADEGNLTQYKLYKIYDEDTLNYKIKDDSGSVLSYLKTLFTYKEAIKLVRFTNETAVSGLTYNNNYVVIEELTLNYSVINDNSILGSYDKLYFTEFTFDMAIEDYLPASISNNTWIQYCEALDIELGLLRTEVEKLLYLYDLRNITDKTFIQELALFFGAYWNTSLSEDINYLKMYASLFYLKNKYKTTLVSYDYICKLVPPYLSTDSYAYFPYHVYNLIYADSKLVKLLDIDMITTNLASHTPGQVFFGIADYDNFSLINSANNKTTIDANTTWTLDDGVYLDDTIYNYPVRRVVVEEIPYTTYTDSDSDVCLIDTNILTFIKDSSAINKKVCETVHAGIQLSMFGSLLSYLTTAGNISALNLQATATEKLIDALSRTYNTDDLFYSVSVGVGEKNICGTTFIAEVSGFDTNFYTDSTHVWSFDEPYGTSIINTGVQDGGVYPTGNGTIYGTYSRTDSSYGKALQLDGATTYCIIPNVYFHTQLKSFSFVINFFSAALNSTQVVFYIHELLTVYIQRGSDTNVYLMLRDFVTSTSYILDTLTPADINTEFSYVWFMNQGSGPLDNIYRNGELVTAISTPSYSIDLPGVNAYIGAYNNLGTMTDFFNGYIDEVRIHSVGIGATEALAMYTNRYTDLTYLLHEIYKQKINISELYDETNYYLISNNVPLNTVNNELILYYTNNTVENVIGTVYSTSIKEKSFRLKYYLDSSRIIEMKDDGYGYLKPVNSTDNYYAEGTLAYDTGAYNINFYVTDSSTKYNLGAHDQVIVLYFNNSNFILNEHTAITYKYDGVSHNAVININTKVITGEGLKIDGTNLVSTTEIYLQFDDNSLASDIELFYQYKKVNKPMLNSAVTVDYISKESLPITELSIKDINGFNVFYATFAKAKVNSHKYHLGSNVILYKS